MAAILVAHCKSRIGPMFLTMLLAEIIVFVYVTLDLEPKDQGQGNCRSVFPFLGCLKNLHSRCFCWIGWDCSVVCLLIVSWPCHRAEKMVTGLRRVSWEKVDVSFHSSMTSFAAHSIIQVPDQLRTFDYLSSLGQLYWCKANNFPKPFFSSCHHGRWSTRSWMMAPMWFSTL